MDFNDGPKSSLQHNCDCKKQRKVIIIPTADKSSKE